MIENLEENKGLFYDVIVSFATFDLRMQSPVIYKILDSIVNQKTELRFKVVANMFKPHWESAPQQLKDYFVKHDIDVKTSDFDYRTFNKLVNVIEEYKNIPIITVDDDAIYTRNLINELYSSHIKFPNSIISGKCKVFNTEIRWGKLKTVEHGVQPNIHFCQWGGYGVLYPVKFLNLLTKDGIDEYIRRTHHPKWRKFSDDFFYHQLAVNNNICTVPTINKIKTWPSELCYDKTAHLWKRS